MINHVSIFFLNCNTSYFKFLSFWIWNLLPKEIDKKHKPPKKKPGFLRHPENLSGFCDPKISDFWTHQQQLYQTNLPPCTDQPYLGGPEIELHPQPVGLYQFIRPFEICAMVKSRYIGDGHPTFNRIPYNGYINPTLLLGWWPSPIIWK